MDKKPNIILIVIDPGNRFHFSCYGYPYNTTPFIDRIARNSILYENCYAPAIWTYPAVASLFTGLYPSKLGILNASAGALPKGVATMAEVLHNFGYDTFGVPNCPWVSRNYGLDRGFQCFIEAFATEGWLAKVSHQFVHFDTQLIKEIKKAVFQRHQNTKPKFFCIHLAHNYLNGGLLLRAMLLNMRLRRQLLLYLI